MHASGRFPVVILAGGQGARMGSPKTMLTHSGFPGYWLAEQVRRLNALAEFGVGSIVIVVGHHASREMAAFPLLNLIPNPNPSLGTFSSLQWGLKAFNTGAFVLPIDVPCPSGYVWQRLIDNTTPDTLAAVPIYEGRGGHPVLISPNLAEQILELDPTASNSRLDRILATLPAHQILRCPVADSTILRNLNSPKEWLAAEL
ncbi:MAG: nucleotidyltransferase family protein [Deltaproteobacteria bacterium]|nr:nucleotidyltransferase family protein [Deltaproteobacteria bacterium]MBI3295000.1 nucleotidyltransferase family protein [Deltaproteobacteria bacterium]